MFLPLPLLLGLLVVTANSELFPVVPGAADWLLLLATLPGLALPTVLAVLALRISRRSLLTGGRDPVPARGLLTLSAVATPASVHLVYWLGGYADFVERCAQDSHLGRMMLAVLPAFVAEVPRIVWGTLAAVTTEIRDELGAGALVAAANLPGRGDVAAFVRMRLGGPLLVAMPILMLGAALDLLELHRGLYAFAMVTTPGVVASAIVFLLAVCAVLPAWFHVAFGVQPLPEPLATPLRAVAKALRFPPARLHLLPTGQRALNAMLVGPLPIGRRLCLTDAIVRELDGEALAGVVAHEVGHAQRGHPAILMLLVVVVPLLLLAPLRLLQLEDLAPVTQAIVGVVGVGVVWWIVRRLSHRFEHEADIASVEALGAGPCTNALLFVSRMATPVPRGWFARWFTMHPEETRRAHVMRRFEQEPAFRAQFQAASRSLRRAIAALAGVALVACAVASVVDWPYEAPIWRLHAGDHRGARELALGVTTPPERWQRAWKFLREDLAVAGEIAPEATDWDTAQPALLATAWARGEQVLLARGPAAARPYFAMWFGASATATDLQRALYAFCDAAADQQPERMHAIAVAVKRLGVPDRLARVFADYQ